MQPELGEYVEALEEQMTEKSYLEYEFWQAGAVQEPEKFMTTPPRFPSQRPVKAAWMD